MGNGTGPAFARLLAVAAVLVVALAAVGCSGEGADDGVATVDDGGVDGDGGEEVGSEPGSVTEEEMLAYTECLREQGIEIGDPRIDADGNVRFGSVDHGDPAVMANIGAAMGACGQPPGGMGGGRGEDSGFEDALLAYARCMRDNGDEDFPDPDLSSAGGEGPFGEIDPDDTDYLAANEVCQDILAGIRPEGEG